MDESLIDTTTERQQAAIEELPHLQRCTEPELRLRSIVLGSPQVPLDFGIYLRAALPLCRQIAACT